MAREATVYKVMIASPSDVHAEREIAREVIHEWNAVNSEDKEIVLFPVGWESHSSPSMEARAQAVINKQVLAGCDLLVAIFWTRLGSPTETSPSGTVEEIEEHLEAGKPAMIYFSTAPVRLDSVDDDQYKALQAFKEECKARGLIEEFGSREEFRRNFSRHLALTILREFLPGDKHNTPPAERVLAELEVKGRILSEDARDLLVEATRDKDGVVLSLDTMGGHHIQTNGRDFVERGDPRSEARWRKALDDLVRMELLRSEGYKGETYRVTADGYTVADQMSNG